MNQALLHRVLVEVGFPAFLFAAVASGSPAQDSPVRTPWEGTSLRGVDSLSVVVFSGDPVRDRLKTVVELELRRSGVPISSGRGQANLALTLETVTAADVDAAAISLRLQLLRSMVPMDLLERVERSVPDSVSALVLRQDEYVGRLLSLDDLGTDLEDELAVDAAWDLVRGRLLQSEIPRGRHITIAWEEASISLFLPGSGEPTSFVERRVVELVQTFANQYLAMNRASAVR